MNEDLSRLLDGELSQSEETLVRERIATEPALAAEWAAMQALPGQLRALPREMAPPALMAPRLSVAAPTSRSVAAPSAPVHRPAKPFFRLAIPLALAAGLLVGVILPRPHAEVRILRGVEMLDGRLDVLAGDLPVRIDGKVEISVEPPRGVARDMLTENPTMDKKAFLAALAGSIVTVSVLEGVAILRPADAAPITLAKGEKRTVGTLDESSTPRRNRSPGDGNPALADAAALRQEIASLKLENAITTGQLRALGGAPQAWPTDLAAPFKPEAFESFVRGRVAGLPNTSLVTMDCDEYPCIAVVRSTDSSKEWQDNLMPVHDDLENTEYGGGVHVIGFGHEQSDDDHSVRLYAFSIVPGDSVGPESDIRNRLDVRVKGDMQGVTEELMSQEAATEDRPHSLGYIE